MPYIIFLYLSNVSKCTLLWIKFTLHHAIGFLDLLSSILLAIPAMQLPANVHCTDGMLWTVRAARRSPRACPPRGSAAACRNCRFRAVSYARHARCRITARARVRCPPHCHPLRHTPRASSKCRAPWRSACP